MADAAGGCVEPFFFMDVVSQRECLQLAPRECCEEIVHVLPADDLLHRVFLLTLGALLDDPARFARDVSLIEVLADDYFVCMAVSFAFANAAV